MGVNKKYELQTQPFVVPTTDGKQIKEHWGLASKPTPGMSIAHMIAPPGWSEPAQTPEFDEFTLVVRGKKQIVIDEETIILEAGQSIKIYRDQKVTYSNPFEEACEYLSICTPAFDFNKVHREAI